MAMKTSLPQKLILCLQSSCVRFFDTRVLSLIGQFLKADGKSFETESNLSHDKNKTSPFS